MTRQAWLKTPKGQEYVARQNKRSSHLANVKAYRKEYSRNKAIATKAWLDYIKLKHGCIDCGYSTYAVALDFDHIDPTTKSFNVSQRRQISKERLLTEIAKCVVRCANCHRVHTQRLNGGRPTHKVDSR